MPHTLLTIMVFLPIVVQSREDWSYKDIKGWSQVSHYCGGKVQSPIDVQFSKSNYTDRLKRMYLIEGESQSKSYLINNGHTAQLGIRHQYVLRNVACESEDYHVEQIHFHWGHGADNQSGSEHLLDGRSYPLEMHMVTYSDWYARIEDAVSNTRALAVVGAFFEVGNESNPLLQPIIDVLKHIRHKGDRTDLKENLDLISLFNMKRLSRYYRYDGSLTTPPCYESVIWSVLSEPLPISSEQLRQFHSLHDASKAPMTGTYRPPQPLGTRKLFRSFHSKDAHRDEQNRRQSTQTNHASHISVNILIITVFVGTLVFRG